MFFMYASTLSSTIVSRAAPSSFALPVAERLDAVADSRVRIS